MTLGYKTILMIEIIVILEINDTALFKAYEIKALEIMRDYDGQLITAFDVDNSESSNFYGSEVHHLKFPDLQNFKDYRGDYRILAMSEQRENAIKNTTVLVSNKFKQYEI